MSMRHVALHDTIDTPSHTHAHARLLERTPLYNRLWALALKTGTDDKITSIFVGRVEINIVTEKCLHRLSNYPAPRRISDGGCRTSPAQSARPRELTIAIQDSTSRYGMSLTKITITKFNGTNYAQWVTEMAQLLEQKQVFCIIKGYDDKPEELAANATATEMAAFKVWMNRHDAARSTILLGMDPRIQAEYLVIDDAKTLWEKLESA